MKANWVAVVVGMSLGFYSIYMRVVEYPYADHTLSYTLSIVSLIIYAVVYFRVVVAEDLEEVQSKSGKDEK